ncbi:MAG TPA: FtsX-like permease family protein [Acidimicrobiales bacterium]|nr:FtsX-like permease family protein [Acidimicrobiales bacterium]
MRRIVLQGLLAHKLRLALTALAIVLGVTFISGTFVLTDTLHNTFTTLFGRIYQNVDFEVRARAAFSSNNGGAGAVRKPIPQSIATSVRHVPGVAYAQGTVNGYAQFVSPDGKAISNGGAPTLGFSYDPNPQLAALNLSQGTAPTSSHDVVMDAGTAQKYHFKVGDHVRVLLSGPPQTFTLSGIVRFGTANNLAGATIAAFKLPVAQRLFGEVGHYDAIDILTSPGTDKSTVQHAIAATLPKGVEVVTGQTVANEQSNNVNQSLSFFSTALLVFAFISLFVGGFTIFNTFSITVGQRTRELALLRIVGASRRQVFRSVLAEAVIVGTVASLAGLGLGVLAALGLEALLKGFGITLPSGSLVFEGRTIIVALVVGVGVTVVSAVGPARRAVRIPPVAALADYRADEEESSRRRIVIGSAMALLGVAALVVGLTRPAIELVGLGAFAIFIGIGMLAPVVARPMASVIGRPLARVFGIAGKLGRENSMRSPRRTAQTASALMVGLALVATIAVFGASLSKSATSSVDNAINANYIITSSAQGGAGGFSNSVSSAAAKVPGVTAVSTVYQGAFELRRSVSNLTAVSTDHLPRTVILRMDSGHGATSLAAGQLLIDTTTANTKQLSVGSVVPVTFAQTGSSTLRVGGIFKPNALLGSYVVGDRYFLAHFDNPLPVAVLLQTENGSSATSKAVDRGLGAYPNLKIQSRAAFKKTQEQQINQLLGLIYALLALAVLIALIGIVNTLMLSVFERTHEIGLLRAVGMKRRQLRAMIRSESVILAIFGAVIGIVVGTALGAAFAASLKQQGITDIVIPVASLVVFVILAALLGLGAASWPARRAAKLDVLTAIATD